MVEFIGERVFNVRGLILAAKEWGALGSKPVIALHGWLDNAASFDLLLPSLKDTHVLAIDSAGHGQSAFRSSDAGYELWQEIPEVIEIADQMGWADFALIGHSRGAVIAARVGRGALRSDDLLPGGPHRRLELSLAAPCRPVCCAHAAPPHPDRLPPRDHTDQSLRQ